MADYHQAGTHVRSDLVEPIAGLMRPTAATVASMVQAAACRRPDNNSFLRTLPILLAGTFPLSRFRQHAKLRKR